MATHLERILASTRAAVAERRQRIPAASLESAAARHQPRGFAAALRRASLRGPAVLAELKKASPSKGLIRPDFDVSALAAALERGGAAALSVLTDEPYFAGSLENLRLASAAVRLPVLRKDFMVDEYQILEARAAGADAILLIAAALADEELARFTRRAHALGLDVLCEVHSSAELERAAGLGCDAYGVNNRDLRSFRVSLDTSLELAGALPADSVHVAESGLSTAADLARLHAAGYHAFLVGESLMRAPDPGQALAALLAGATAAAAQPGA